MMNFSDIPYSIQPTRLTFVPINGLCSICHVECNTITQISPDVMCHYDATFGIRTCNSVECNKQAKDICIDWEIDCNLLNVDCISGFYDIVLKIRRHSGEIVDGKITKYYSPIKIRGDKILIPVAIEGNKVKLIDLHVLYNDNMEALSNFNILYPSFLQQDKIDMWNELIQNAKSTNIDIID